MDKVRCVIAEMPQKLLADIVQNMVEDSGVIEVVSRIDGSAEISSEIATHSADVLILGMKSEQIPCFCTDIMNRNFNLSVVGLVDDGRRLAVYLDNIGKDDILRIVKALHPPKSGSKS